MAFGTSVTWRVDRRVRVLTSFLGIALLAPTSEATLENALHRMQSGDLAGAVLMLESITRSTHLAGRSSSNPSHRMCFTAWAPFTRPD